MKVYYKHSVPV